MVNVHSVAYSVIHVVNVASLVYLVLNKEKPKYPMLGLHLFVHMGYYITNINCFQALQL